MFACYGNNIADLEIIIQKQIQFLRQYEFLFNMYTLDYFVCNHWYQIPESWRNCLNQFKVEDLGNFLDEKNDFRFCKPLPLSLLSFRASTFAIRLPRHTENPLHLLNEFLHKAYGLPKNEHETFTCENSSQSNTKYSSQHKDLPKYCRLHVKLKKQHEICLLSQFTNSALQKINVNSIMDIGSGLGHLSRLLCLKYNFTVTTLEAESSHVHQAGALDKEALQHLKKDNAMNYLPKTPPILMDEINVTELPHHQEIFVKIDSSHKTLQEVIKKAWMKKNNKVIPQFGLMGLHTCGDLSASLMRLFVNSAEAKALLSVSCCYMKLNTEESSYGFPLSNFVHEYPLRLSSESREIACHALEKYIKRLKENSESLKIHCYRAILEKLIVKQYPNLKHMGLRGVKNAEKLKFHEYATKVLANVPIEIPFAEICEFGETFVKEWKNVVIMYSLRLLTAPVIESLILCDRMMFLHEHGLKSCIIPIFHPFVSPRNHLLFSIKNP